MGCEYCGKNYEDIEDGIMRPDGKYWCSLECYRKKKAYSKKGD